MLRKLHMNKKNILIILLITFFLFFPGHIYSQNTELNSVQNIINPYQEINWENINYYKANLHSHTEQSDGYHSVKRVISAFNLNDYDILAITDHNRYTWPWSNYIDNSFEKKLNITPVNGSEISNTHHIGSYFNDFSGETESEIKVLNEIHDRNGLAVFFHPGRYQKSKEWYINY